MSRTLYVPPNPLQADGTTIEENSGVLSVAPAERETAHFASAPADENGGTWAFDTNYQNTSTKAKWVTLYAVLSGETTDCRLEQSADAATWVRMDVTRQNGRPLLKGIVPPGYYYRVIRQTGANTITASEHRSWSL